MGKTLLALAFLIVSFPAFCFSSKDLDFKCQSDDSLWLIEKEKEREAFAFWYDGRLVAYRHLVWTEAQLFTNFYDLDLRVTFEKGLGKGSLKGRLMGKNWVLEGLICEAGPRP